MVGQKKEVGDGEGRSFLFLPPPLPCSNFSTPLKINMVVIYGSRRSRTEENACNTGYNLKQVTG